MSVSDGGKLSGSQLPARGSPVRKSLAAFHQGGELKLEDLDTPALIVDLDIMERNLDRMSAYCGRHDLQLCPHTKTHKSPWLALEQLKRGAAGITVAKLGEAEVMAADGISEMLIAYPILGPRKGRRLGRLLEGCQVTISLDSEQAAETVSSAAGGHQVGILVEVDLGMRRCGLPPGDAPVRLARLIESLPALRFDGILFYPGHLRPSAENHQGMLRRLNDKLGRQLELFRRQRIPVRRVSGGNTPSAFFSHRITGMTDIRPGTYIFNDRNTVQLGGCGWEDCAAFVYCTVVSNTVTGQAVVDGGSKTFSSDGSASGKAGGHGRIRGFPKIELFRLNEEHGYLRLQPDTRLEIGQPLEIVPNHICAVVNLHRTVWGIRNGKVVKEWEVLARGRIR